MKQDLPSQADYNERYLEWKGWNSQKPFGHLPGHTKALYQAQVRSTKLKQINNVLEIGFGNGEFLSFAKSKGWQITGTELSEQLVQIAQKQGYNAIPANELENLSASSFDLIVAFDVFEHIPPAQIESFINTLKSKLRPGGCLLARFPNGDSPLGLPFQNGDMTHTHAIGSNIVRYLAGQTQMQIVRVGGEIIPTFSSCLSLTLYALISNPLRWLHGLYLKFVYFPNKSFALNAPNMVAILKRP